MTQEEKQLLFIDLCARLPHGVVIEITSDGGMVEASYDMKLDAELLADLLHSEDDFKPYLRPLESMTEEEFQELHNICPHSTFNKTNDPGWIIGIDGSKYGRISRIDEISKLLDWLNKNMFDFRGLIPMGLALEAKEGMYKTNRL